jgi:DNA mismatch repair protein MutL
MADLIKLLPDALANQIAAGEVVQRPASVVKELLENALDAGADKISLLVKDGGKSWIQVIDNGTGMSETDARLSFERHATSKISQSSDLFNIRTMGFRGEALASIAAVAQVEMKTKRKNDELGSRVFVEASRVIVQEPCQALTGTSIKVSNLFFNVPARKKFLKSDARELQHIEEEFVHIAMAYPEIEFSMFIEDREVYKLPKGKLRQRIVGILGNNFNKNLVPVKEETDVLTLHGYVGLPETAKKRRGDQYLFVNGRFIKSPYLNHAISSAYENMLPEGSFPFYCIFLELDPEKIDVNVHPTKQEIKFDDEKIIYNYLKVSVRYSLSTYQVAPSLDFDQEPSFAELFSGSRPDKNPSMGSGFKSREFESGDKRDNLAFLDMYEKLFSPEESKDKTVSTSSPDELQTQQDQFQNEMGAPGEAGHYQVHNKFIICPVRSGILIIDQRAAHERILFEHFLEAFEQHDIYVQKELFPKVVELKAIEAAMLSEILPEINVLGFEIELFGQNSFIIQGTPSVDLLGLDAEQLLYDLISQYQSNLNVELNVNEKVAVALARAGSVKSGTRLSREEMQLLTDRLFACKMPYKSPTGRKCFINYDLEDLDSKFN